MLSLQVIDPTQSTEYNYEFLNRELDRAKSGVFMAKDAGFFGPLMCALDFVWAKGLETAANDGSTFWWDPMDFTRLCIEGRKSTIMHELWHVARLHALRRGNRCPDIWNIACDIWINRHLLQQGYQLLPPELWVIRPELDAIELEEQIYDYLISPGGGGMTPGQSPGGAHGNCKHGQVVVTPQVKQQLINSTVKAIQSAKMNNQAGSIPGGVESTVNKFLKSIIPWETHLHKFFTDLLEEDYTWARPNRRYPDMYLPSRYEDEGRLEHIIMYEDVSGSVGPDDSLRFNSELKFIWETFKPKKMTIVQFDTIIQKIDVLEEDDPFNEIRIVGGGGTSLRDVRKHIMDNKPTAAIVFSDLFVDPMTPGPQCPVLWVAIGNTSAQVNFGKLIHIKGGI